MPAFLLALVLAFVLGFAAHRASVCTVRAVAEVMHARTSFMFRSIGKSILWILAVTLPFYFLVPGAVLAYSGWQFTLTALAGGLLFGIGAGINGACAYSTMARCVDGEPWLPVRWRDSTVALAPVGRADRVVALGRVGGPPVLETEVLRLAHLALLASAVADGHHSAG